MTRKQFEVKTKKLIKELKPYLLKESLRLYDSGGIDVDRFENNFVLPTLIFKVNLQNQVDQYIIKDSNKKDFHNLANF